jgi:MFS family permease
VNKKLLILIITAGVDMVGTFLVLPILPFYAKSLGANGFVTSCLTAAFSLATLISAPYWGRFSDRYGRRPALLIALVGSALGYLIFAFADSIWLLLLSRIVQGAGGGTVGVIQAYVADATEPKNRAKALGWLSAATNAGVGVGPIIGSAAFTLGKHVFALGDHSFTLGSHTPGLLAACICVLNMYFVWRNLRETRVVTQNARRSVPVERGWQVMKRVVQHSDEPASRLIWIYAIGLGAFYGVTTVLILYLGARFDFNEQSIGPFFTYMAGVSIISRAVLLGPAIDKFGEVRLARFGTVLLALGLALIPLAPTRFLFFCVSPLLNVGTAFTFPVVTSLLSRVISVDERGVYMGTQQAFGGITRVIFPLGAGLLYDRVGTATPFWVAAGLVATTLLMGLNMESYARTDTPAPPTPVPATPEEVATAKL